MKRVIIVHGWGGNPTEGWFPYLRKKLEEKGLEVVIPQMPDPEKPRIYNWVPKLAEVAGNIDKDTYFIGHSMGCQTIVRYLESLPAEKIAGGAIFVAGFFKRLTGLEADVEVQSTDRHWLEAPLDFGKVRAHLPKSVAIFSDNDPWVPLDNKEDFESKLDSKIIIENNKGHFSGEQDNCFELPVVVAELLSLAEV